MFLTSWYEHYKKFSESFRAKYFQPILKLLAFLKITPNQITIGRWFFIWPLAYFFYLGNYAGVISFYVVFWLLDLFDGSLARYLKTQSDKGRFLDTVVDNFMYGALIIGIIYWQAALAWLLAANLLLEYAVQILGIIKNQPKLKSDWIIKAQADLPYFKTASHLALLLFFLGLNYLNPIFAIINLGLLLTCIYIVIEIKNNV